ncbi:MAG: TraR/DksA family transcriptional regulator [Oligoflexia bacterium]|nr:TraR/DksA family transcriptional regulator [Oligoflexia bacterium]
MAGQEADAERLWLFMNRDGNIENRVNKALKRMEYGQYGICIECDSPIPYKRLLIDPTSELCINCKSELELTN